MIIATYWDQLQISKEKCTNETVINHYALLTILFVQIEIPIFIITIQHYNYLSIIR